jgi:hypothetical protein
VSRTLWVPGDAFLAAHRACDLLPGQGRARPCQAGGEEFVGNAEIVGVGQAWTEFGDDVGTGCRAGIKGKNKIDRFKMAAIFFSCGLIFSYEKVFSPFPFEILFLFHTL